MLHAPKPVTKSHRSDLMRSTCCSHRLPSSKLAGVKVSSAAGIVVVVDKGFTVKTLNATLLGAADLVFKNITASSVRLVNTGYARPRQAMFARDTLL